MKKESKTGQNLPQKFISTMETRTNIITDNKLGSENPSWHLFDIFSALASTLVGQMLHQCVSF